MKVISLSFLQEARARARANRFNDRIKLKRNKDVVCAPRRVCPGGGAAPYSVFLTRTLTLLEPRAGTGNSVKGQHPASVRSTSILKLLCHGSLGVYITINRAFPRVG